MAPSSSIAPLLLLLCAAAPFAAHARGLYPGGSSEDPALYASLEKEQLDQLSLAESEQTPNGDAGGQIACKDKKTGDACRYEYKGKGYSGNCAIADYKGTPIAYCKTGSSGSRRRGPMARRRGLDRRRGPPAVRRRGPPAGRRRGAPAPVNPMAAELKKLVEEVGKLLPLKEQVQKLQTTAGDLSEKFEKLGEKCRPPPPPLSVQACDGLDKYKECTYAKDGLGNSLKGSCAEKLTEGSYPKFLDCGVHPVSLACEGKRYGDKCTYKSRPLQNPSIQGVCTWGGASGSDNHMRCLSRLMCPSDKPRTECPGYVPPDIRRRRTVRRRRFNGDNDNDDNDDDDNNDNDNNDDNDDNDNDNDDNNDDDNNNNDNNDNNNDDNNDNDDNDANDDNDNNDNDNDNENDGCDRYLHTRGCSCKGKKKGETCQYLATGPPTSNGLYRWMRGRCAYLAGTIFTCNGNQAFYAPKPTLKPLPGGDKPFQPE